MKICYVPTYDNAYSRIKIIRTGLAKNGVEIIDCSDQSPVFLWRCVKVFTNYLKKKKDCDLILVGFIGQPMLPFIRWTTRKKVVLDAFMSLYNTLVEDKKVVGGNTLMGQALLMLDKLACRMADLVLIDTDEHRDYFARTFNISKEKFRRVLIGADDTVFYPVDNIGDKPDDNQEGDIFTVLFHGSFIPLQGIEFIIRAAEILQKEKICFKLIGNGQTYKENKILARKLKLENVEFLDFLPIDKVADEIKKAHVCLGIFGETLKTRLVIPNKAYEILAMQKALVTADTPAVREIFEPDRDLVLCRRKDTASLADAILKLNNNPSLRQDIARKGYLRFVEKCTPEKIGQELKNDLIKFLWT
jgi:glycosyltransferase involved in cell wall biosynthesis